MKVHLMYPDQDPRRDGEVPPGSADLVRDLGLDTMLTAMARGDPYLYDVVTRTLLNPLSTPADIVWRQGVLDDLIRHPQAAADLYALAIDGLESQKKVRGWLFSGRSAGGTLSAAIQSLQVLIDPLRALRRFSDEHRAEFDSPALTSLMTALATDLSDDYFAVLEDHLRRLHFPSGVVVTARLGAGLKNTDIVLRKPHQYRRRWRDLFDLRIRDPFTYTLPDRDEAGAQAMSELRDRGVNLVADALAQSTDHILSFFAALRWEVGFYLGCIELHARMAEKGLPTAVPDPRPPAVNGLQARGLVDACLGLQIGHAIVGNDLRADGKRLVLITGTNQGGKSTMLRAIGLAQLMMQSGMFVAATSYRASVTPRLHTHFTREEDAAMNSGKLEEELARMSRIAERAAPGDLVLFNESFACTNEREGSSIARQILDGLVDAGLRAVYVTHMYDLSHSLFAASREDALFLRPERLPDGRRTFRVVEEAPLPTSFGKDLYDRVFGAA